MSRGRYRLTRRGELLATVLITLLAAGLVSSLLLMLAPAGVR